MDAYILSEIYFVRMLYNGLTKQLHENMRDDQCEFVVHVP